MDERLRLNLRRHIDAATMARHRVRRLCEHMPDHVSATMELLTSELVTNAVVHGEGDIELVIFVGETGLRVEVLDESLTLPPRVVSDPNLLDDHGLALVDALASSWGTTPHDDRPGKTVWFTVKT